MMYEKECRSMIIKLIVNGAKRTQVFEKTVTEMVSCGMCEELASALVMQTLDNITKDIIY